MAPKTTPPKPPRSTQDQQRTLHRIATARIRAYPRLIPASPHDMVLSLVTAFAASYDEFLLADGSQTIQGRPDYHFLAAELLVLADLLSDRTRDPAWDAECDAWQTFIYAIPDPGDE